MPDLACCTCVCVVHLRKANYGGAGFVETLEGSAFESEKNEASFFTEVGTYSLH